MWKTQRYFQVLASMALKGKSVLLHQKGAGLKAESGIIPKALVDMGTECCC